MVESTQIKRVYVAGSYSDKNVITILNNIRRGIRMAVKLFLAGYSPFCPFLDYQFQFLLRNDEQLSVEDYYRYSMDWLEVSDALLILPGWENSKGTNAEYHMAKELGIPVFFDFEELKEWERTKRL